MCCRGSSHCAAPVPPLQDICRLPSLALENEVTGERTCLWNICCLKAMSYEWESRNMKSSEEYSMAFNGSHGWTLGSDDGLGSWRFFLGRSVDFYTFHSNTSHTPVGLRWHRAAGVKTWPSHPISSQRASCWHDCAQYGLGAITMRDGKGKLD